MKHIFIVSLLVLMISQSAAAQNSDTVINRYINALGGREKLEQVKDRITYLSGVVEGTKVTVTIYQKAPNFFRQDISSKNINQMLYYNGEKGILVSDAGNTELTGQTLKDLQLDAYLNPVLDLKAKGVSVNYAGTEEILGKKAEKLELSTDSTRRWTEYYDNATGLKLRQAKTIESSTGSFDQITDFDDYRVVEGIKYPFKLTQSIGKQKIIMEVKLIKVNTAIEDSIFNPEKE